MAKGKGAHRFAHLLRAWRNRSLRRLCLATAAFRTAELAVWIAMIAYAYGVGGVGEASIVTIAQLVPATVFALAVGGLVRRHGARAVLRWGLGAQSAGMLVAAVFLHQGQDLIAYAAAIVTASAMTTTRPSHSVMTPALVDDADELTAANVFAGGLHAIAGLIGPLTAALVMTAVGSWAVFAAMAVVVALAAAAVWRLPDVRTAGEEDIEALVEGLRAVAREPGPRVMVLGIAIYYVVIGAIDVLAVVIAVEILGKTEAYSGFVTTAAGVGCVIAGGVGVAVIGRRWISAWILGAALAVGAALIAVSFVGEHVVGALLVLVAFGVAEATYELTALMLLQRVSRLDLIGHIFALVESMAMAMLAVGTAAVPLAVKLVGSERAPAAIGVLFLVLVGALSTRIVSIDRHARVPITEMAVLRMSPLFGALPGPALETVAREARRVEAQAGEPVVREGDHGTEYFVVVTGRLVVIRDGAEVRVLERGDAFGEIALLHDVPRTATVRASTSAVLLAVARDPFLTAVTGHASTHDRAATIAARHMEQ